MAHISCKTLRADEFSHRCEIEDSILAAECWFHSNSTHIYYNSCPSIMHTTHNSCLFSIQFVALLWRAALESWKLMKIPLILGCCVSHKLSLFVSISLEFCHLTLCASSALSVLSPRRRESEKPSLDFVGDFCYTFICDNQHARFADSLCIPAAVTITNSLELDFLNKTCF
jgi:hypothetical protein